MINVEDCKEVFEGNDSATSFPFDFKVNAATDLEVGLSIADAAATVLTLNSHYSVSLNANQDTNPGGTITYPLSGDPLADGDKLYVLRVLDALQPAAFTAGVAPATLEQKFDNLTMLVQQLQEKLNRSIVGAVTDTGTLPALPYDRAGKFIAFDASRNPTVSSGTGADAGLREDLASTDAGKGADLVGGAIKYLTPEQFGAVGDGSTDDSAAIQLLFDEIRDTGGVAAFRQRTYKCGSGLTLLRNTTGGPERYIIHGNGAILSFPGVTSGDALALGATSQANGHDTGNISIYDLTLLGPESANPGNEANDPDGSTVGLSLEYAFNTALYNVKLRRFYTGVKTFNVWPFDSYSLDLDNCYIGLHAVTNSTLSQFFAPRFLECRYGMLLGPSANTETVQSQVFHSPRIEGCVVGCVVDPLDGSGIGVFAPTFYAPRIENIQYDVFRLGTAFTFATPETRGADRSRNVYNPVIDLGLWDAGAGWNGTDHNPLVLPSSGDGVVGGRFRLPCELADIIGVSATSGFDLLSDPTVGASSIQSLIVPKNVVCGTASSDYPLTLGAYRLWVDGSGLLRIKNGVPSSSTDGTIVGTQS